MILSKHHYFIQNYFTKFETQKVYDDFIVKTHIEIKKTFAIKKKMNKQRLNKRVVENDDEYINENKLNIENFKYFFDFRFQFNNERFSMNKKK